MARPKAVNAGMRELQNLVSSIPESFDRASNRRTLFRVRSPNSLDVQRRRAANAALAARFADDENDTSSSDAEFADERPTKRMKKTRRGPAASSPEADPDQDPAADALAGPEGDVLVTVAVSRAFGAPVLVQGVKRRDVPSWAKLQPNNQRLPAGAGAAGAQQSIYLA